MALYKSGVILCFMFLSVQPVSALDVTIEVPSRTLSDESFLRGDDGSGSPVTLTGRLVGPDIEEKAPAVILLHGSDGPRSGAAASWLYYFKSIGITTLRLDSYTARGLSQASTGQNRFGQFTQIYDAYRAADALAAHPKVDGSRIVLMGFSRGGNAALYGAMTRFQKAFGPEQARIVAYVAFYPACNFELIGELEVSNAPIREFHGTDDDWTSPVPCRDYIARLKAVGANADMTEYPGALHAFDSMVNRTRVTDPHAQTSRNCFRREEGGRIINRDTGKPFTYDDTCVEYGPSWQYNEVATMEAQAGVRSMLESLFGRTGTAQE